MDIKDILTVVITVGFLFLLNDPVISTFGIPVAIVALVLVAVISGKINLPVGPNTAYLAFAYILFAVVGQALGSAYQFLTIARADLVIQLILLGIIATLTDAVLMGLSKK